MINTGTIIAKLRKEAGYTQKTLADTLHITDKAVSKWERGICLPDVSLLPKLSLLLDADIELILAQTAKGNAERWFGFLDFKDSSLDLSRIICDKPAVYYILSHYLLLGIRDIYVRCSRENEKYLSGGRFTDMGINFIFNVVEISGKNLMIARRPIFIFGSDLTRQYQGAMVSGSIIKLAPVGSPVPFLFCPAPLSKEYLSSPDTIEQSAAERTLGRGMVCISMDTEQHLEDISSFVRIYQSNTGLQLENIEEFGDTACGRGIVTF